MNEVNERSEWAKWMARCTQDFTITQDPPEMNGANEVSGCTSYFSERSEQMQRQTQWNRLNRADITLKKAEIGWNTAKLTRFNCKLDQNDVISRKKCRFVRKNSTFWDKNSTFSIKKVSFIFKNSTFLSHQFASGYRTYNHLWLVQRPPISFTSST